MGWILIFLRPIPARLRQLRTVPRLEEVSLSERWRYCGRSAKAV